MNIPAATELDHVIQERNLLMQQVIDLKQDKARLDWLGSGLGRWRKVCSVSTEKMDLREAIDEAMKDYK